MYFNFSNNSLLNYWLLEARVNAIESMYAAVIQGLKEICNSTDVINAAHIQGRYTLGAGVFVLIAACLAYIAATRETRRHEKREKLRRLAYRFTIKTTLENLFIDIKKIKEEREQMGKNEVSKDITTFPIPPTNLALSNWENHALLEQDEIVLIYTLLPLLEINYLYALYKNKQQHKEGYECDLILSMNPAENAAKKKFHEEMWSNFCRTKEYEQYNIKCSGMEDKDYDENIKEVINILGSLKRIKELSL